MKRLKIIILACIMLVMALGMLSCRPDETDDNKTGVSTYTDPSTGSPTVFFPDDEF